MIRKVAVLVLMLLVSTSSLFAQKVLNHYKYIVVPIQFEFQKGEDQHQLNSLTKFLFEKQGYTVFLSNEAFPEDLAKNPCLALKSVIINDSGMLSTKLKINLVDCYNTVVFSTAEGKSKIKDYKKAYHEATRNAFITIEAIGYEYDGTIPTVYNKPVTNSTVTKVEPEVAAPVAASEIVEIQTKEPVEVKTELAPVEVTPAAQVKAPTAEKVAETAIAVPVVVPTVASTPTPAPKTESKSTYTIEGKYFIDMWGECVIAKKGDGYSIVGGDEDFEFATISSTSKSTIFMVKKTGFSQSQLLELNSDGNLQIDTDNGVKVFKRLK